MKKYSGTRYNSRFDLSTWLILLFVAVCCIWPIFLENDYKWQWTIVGLTAVFIGLIILLLKSIYYRIDGNNLVVYQFFCPSAFPIDKIESIAPTRSLLSAPAASLTHRLAIKFTDRSVLKSSMPLVISPDNQDQFIAQLLSLNPHIKQPGK